MNASWGRKLTGGFDLVGGIVSVPFGAAASRSSLPGLATQASGSVQIHSNPHTDALDADYEDQLAVSGAAHMQGRLAGAPAQGLHEVGGVRESGASPDSPLSGAKAAM
jgi:hypothetical protein